MERKVRVLWIITGFIWMSCTAIVEDYPNIYDTDTSRQNENIMQEDDTQISAGDSTISTATSLDAYTDMGAHADTDKGTADALFDTDTDIDTESDTVADTDADTDTDNGSSEADIDTESDSVTALNTDAEETDSKIGTDSGTDTNLACPTECDGSDVCTLYEMTVATEGTCDWTCDAIQITACVSDDGCCPAGCSRNDDFDCTSICGNGEIELGETCDPPESCPSSCDDGMSCTTDHMSGSAANCNAECSHSTILICQSGDGCCPLTCTSLNDSDCDVACGNDVVEPLGGEFCDPPESCATSCDDDIACTVDDETGSAEDCDFLCSHTNITECIFGDDCCPAGCNSVSDADCPVNCGDEVVDLLNGETCDPPGTCPTGCDDGIACTTDLMTGSAENCNALCSHTDITTCTHDDGCCLPACNSVNDNDCPVICGDEVVDLDAGETCDPPDSCLTGCDDGVACTADFMTGSALYCNVACSHEDIDICTAGDGCCPGVCGPAIDADCPGCGNGEIELIFGETCDPPESCPVTCDDGNACTTDEMAGSPIACNVVCGHTSITACVSGDGCCPAGCNADNDSDCCRILYPDADGDGYGNPGGAACLLGMPSGYVTNGGDCCDSDANANPGQSAYFVTARTGCGGFDYNCDGSESGYYGTSWTENNGWDNCHWHVGVYPGCGGTGTADCCDWEPMCYYPQRTEQCR